MLELDRPSLLQPRALVGGAWIDADDRAAFPVDNPATAARLAEVADCGGAEARRAVDAAAAAFPGWKTTTPAERRKWLKAWAAAIAANAEDLARLISLEQGKPLAESRAEIAYGLGYIDWFADEAVRAYGETIPSPHPRRRLTTVREPVGVVALITPWNFPFAMLARKIAPAVAAGCTVVVKPAEDTPLTALAMGVLAVEAGGPAGLVNIIPASRGRAAAISEAWLSDDRVRKLSFTGSTPVGKLLARGSAETLKRVSMELGGNAPFIVFDDADIDRAVAGAIAAKFRNTGQTCVSPNRFLVQSGAYDAFASALAKAVSALAVGPADEAASQIGPLINAASLAKVEAHVTGAVAAGARAAAGGARHARGGLFYQPTVLTGVTPAMTLSCEETFGPVAALQRFEDEAAAIALANDTPFGLAAYLYTRDIGRLTRVAEALEVGMVGMNEALISTEVAPFGGVKQSGYGREGSSHGLSDYQSIKYLCLGV